MSDAPRISPTGRFVLRQSPDGALVVQGETPEGVVMADVSLERVRRWRRKEIGRDDSRRPEQYAAIADPDHPRPLRRTQP